MGNIRDRFSSLSDDGMSPPEPAQDIVDDLGPPLCALEPITSGMKSSGECPECADDGMSSLPDTDKADGMKGPGGCPECVDDGMSPPSP